jgi:hypothetical protein
VDWLSEDLLLLALDAGRGRLGRFFVIDYALMGAELVRLAASGRIGIADDQVVVRNPAPTGDAELDAALARIGEPASPPRPGEWVERPRPRICGRYLERLMATGVICEQTRFGSTRWRITGAARLAEARQRLDLIACSAGPVDLSQTAYAALACALGLDRLLYPGRGRRAERDRLREIATGRWITSPALASDSAHAAALPDASNGPDRAAIDAATLAGIRAATHAVAYAAAAATMAGAASSSPALLSASMVVPGQIEATLDVCWPGPGLQAQYPGHEPPIAPPGAYVCNCWQAPAGAGRCHRGGRVHNCAPLGRCQALTGVGSWCASTKKSPGLRPASIVPD